MTRQERIERIEQTDKMAQSMCGFCDENKRCVLRDNKPCREVMDQDCGYKESAEMLICKGYGNISEYKSEIERLKANGYLSIMDAFENNRDKIVENIQTEIDDYKQSIKQAKIDVLNDIKKRIYDISPYNPLVTKDDVKRFIDKLIDEVNKNGTNS